MPQFRQQTSWRVEGGGQVIDLETAVKDGILGGGADVAGAIPTGEDGILGTATDKLDLKQMIEELNSAAEDDVPSVFICPISLEPMIDPVTLCTGQTYERVHILKWFSLGHLTCPTTMQELWDDAVTPNRTLHQLIHAWLSQRYLLLKKRSEDVQGRAAELVQRLKKVKGQARVQALRDLQNIIVAHPSAKKTVADSAGAHLSSLLGPFTSHAVGSEVIAILVNLSLDSDAMTNLMHPAKISLVVDMLNEGTNDTKINCTRFIDMLMGEKSFRYELVSSLSLLVALLRLVKDCQHPNGIAAGLKLLKSICSHEQVRSLIVSVGAVPQLVEQLPKLKPDCLEPALHILDDLSTVAKGRLALKDCPQTIFNVVKLLMKGSCTPCVLSILLSVCKLAPDDCVPLALEVGLGAQLLLLIQSNCTPEVKQQAAELLKLFCSLNCTNTLFISKCSQGKATEAYNIAATKFCRDCAIMNFVTTRYGVDKIMTVSITDIKGLKFIDIILVAQPEKKVPLRMAVTFCSPGMLHEYMVVTIFMFCFFADVSDIASKSSC
ncbi:U-box domain-containing protein 30-like [Canna indica]|uniref:U-box domain-containing protein n=1 Tax=Canna indica TaxID=4628 RepID=A0AAQ3Q828_9LILI|nr:U-box domain-containing protein 30-like [Canna indica]